MAGDDNRAGEATMAAIPLAVASEAAEKPAARRLRFAVPKIVDYLIVATFIYFVF